MQADRWQQIEKIFHAALERTPNERAALLADTCGGDEELRREVESLLATHEQDKSLLKIPASDLAADWLRMSLVGKRIGRYRLTAKLGEGGMGVVYRAEDEALRRTVAIKILVLGKLADSERKRRLLQEARAVSALNHPNIITVYDIGSADGLDFIAMEYVEGRTLGEVLASQSLALAEKLTFAVQISEALAAAHARGIIHRDLKPGNIMVSREGQIKVLDFGLAKLQEGADDPTRTVATEAGMIVGTLAYMSPEQAQGLNIDGRSDIFSFGAILYEMLTGRRAFQGDSNARVLAAVLAGDPRDAAEAQPDLPRKLLAILRKTLAKRPDERYQRIDELTRDLDRLRKDLEPELQKRRSRMRLYVVSAGLSILLAAGAAVWFYQRSEKRHWARTQAIPEITRLASENKYLAGFLLMRESEPYLPDDPQLAAIAENTTRVVSIRSSPAGAVVEIKDYLSPEMAWFRLGTTPLEKISIPAGHFRWRVSKQGVGEYSGAPSTESEMNFQLDSAESTPEGMVRVPGGRWVDAIGFLGWLGPYDLPPFFIDRFEVTNRQYQDFVDKGGYKKQEYWKQKFFRDGRELSWEQAIDLFRDTTGRPGPSTWEAGRYPEGQADYPVSGVSWFEAGAYAAFSGKSLPALAQWYKAAHTALASYIVRQSNFSGSSLAPVGKFAGMGPYGTYDMAGNVREWSWNEVDENRRFILGGVWDGPAYIYGAPEAFSPFDRSPGNGFRCVRNTDALPSEVMGPRTYIFRDFSKAKPAPDDVFRIYQNMYAYEKTPLNAKVEAVKEDSKDWTKEKITFDAAYGTERMPVYLFLPKNVRPPYQTVVFFPSARVSDIPTSRTLGDMRFIDYVIMSGRAVLYPVYQDMYERRAMGPRGPRPPSRDREIWIQRSKDLGRSIDYLESRSDIDSGKVGYLGVSIGGAMGVILTSLEERLRAVVFLDGGLFHNERLPGTDQIDFAARLRKPVLMINGRYDYTFLLEKGPMPMFRMLGTPEADKRHVVLEVGHDVTAQRTELAREVLAWFDKYLGKVD